MKLVVLALAVALAALGVALTAPTADATNVCVIGPAGSGCILQYECPESQTGGCGGCGVECAPP